MSATDEPAPIADAGRKAKAATPVDDPGGSLERLARLTRKIVRVPVAEVRALEKAKRRKRKPA